LGRSAWPKPAAAEVQRLGWTQLQGAGAINNNVPDYDADKIGTFDRNDGCLQDPKKTTLGTQCGDDVTMTMTQSWNSSMTKQLEFTMWRWHYLNGMVLKSIPVPPRISNCKSGCEKQEWQNQKTSDGASTSNSNKADGTNGTLVAVAAPLIQIQQGISTPTLCQMRKTNY